MKGRNMPQNTNRVQGTLATLVVTIAPDADAAWSQLCDDIGVSEFDFADDGGKVRFAITSNILIKDRFDSEDYDGLSFELIDAEPKNLPECPALLARSAPPADSCAARGERESAGPAAYVIAVQAVDSLPRRRHMARRRQGGASWV
jgi:hypothetical protein